MITLYQILYVFFHAYYMLFISMWDVLFNFNIYFTKLVNSTDDLNDFDDSM